MTANSYINKMALNENTLPAMLGAYLLILVLVATCVYLAHRNGDFDCPRMNVGALMEWAEAVRRVERRRKREADNDSDTASKRSRMECDYERAHMCVTKII